jgi:hypothetical protein
MTLIGFVDYLQDQSLTALAVAFIATAGAWLYAEWSDSQ